MSFINPIPTRKNRRERTITTGGGVTAPSRRRLDTAGASDDVVAPEDGAETNVEAELDIDEEFQESKEFGDDVLNGNMEEDTGSNADASERKMKPTVCELVNQVSDEDTRRALHGVLEHHWDLDDEVQRNTVSIRSQGQRLANVEAGLPTRVYVYPEKGGNLQKTRNTLSRGIATGHFRNLIRGLNNWREPPLQMDVTDANPNAVALAVQLVMELDPKLHPVSANSNKVLRQNDQAKFVKSILKATAERYAKEHKCQEYYLNFSWPANRKEGRNAESWSIGVTVGDDTRESIVMTCSYDHVLLRQEYIVDIRVVSAMQWEVLDFKKAVDEVSEELPMFREDILYAKDAADRLCVQGKQRFEQERQAGKGASPMDVTPPSTASGLLAGVKLPDSFKGNSASAGGQSQYKGKPNGAQQYGKNSGPYGGKQTQGAQQYGGNNSGSYGGGSYQQQNGYGKFAGEGGGFGKPGDWNCSTCDDYQFARNRQCRSCGAPAPHVMGGQFPMKGGFPAKGNQGGQEFPPKPPVYTNTPPPSADWLGNMEGDMSPKFSSSDVAWMAQQLQQCGVPLPGGNGPY